MDQAQWYTNPALRALAAVAVAALGFVIVNPFMSNDRMFGKAPWGTIALFLPALAAGALLHFLVPRKDRSSLRTYCVRVVGTSVFAYAAAAFILMFAAFVITGELL